jgi:Mlc titration factor MtfA (ptsG expression regulator)
MRWFSGKPRAPRRPIPQGLWQDTLKALPWLQGLDENDLARLRELASMFLEDKEFHGAQGLEITDAMAVNIAAQACLPVLHFGEGAKPLRWYDDFVTLVIHPGEVVAPRAVVDEIGIVHEYEEELAGESMPEGPVMLSWQDVSSSSIEDGYNVVIHEFVHKLDLRDGEADGCPPLPKPQRERWMAVMQKAFDDFREAVAKADRFGEPEPWLDPYGAEHISEFFAVASEAYFVNRARLAEEFPALKALFDEFYQLSGIKRLPSGTASSGA